ncbi:MAG: lysozyme inhibitor LprI family protein [Methylobacillus sp.]|nr:lysozyme inhibitor LprI family protein [Methylobacillus sp.]
MKRISTWLSPLLVGAFLLIPTASLAASFDCGKAATHNEKRICALPRLSEMDTKLDALYKKLATGADAAAWNADQQAWLKERNNCEYVGCLLRRYNERLVVLENSAKPFQWKGGWQRVDSSGGHNAASLTLSVAPQGVKFNITAMAGANAGELEGVAALDKKQSSAIYTDGKTINCKLTFRQKLNRIVVETAAVEKGKAIDCGAGVGVIYDGDYVAAAKDPNPQADLLTLGVVNTPEQDAAIRKLTGKDYSTLVMTADVISDTSEDAKMPGVTMISTYVRGLASSVRAIVMRDEQDHYWIGVWQDADGGKVEMRYYTNVAADKKKLPKAIANEVDPANGVVVRMMP